jgi:hypothetical protein
MGCGGRRQRSVKGKRVANPALLAEKRGRISIPGGNTQLLHRNIDDGFHKTVIDRVL